MAVDNLKNEPKSHFSRPFYGALFLLVFGGLFYYVNHLAFLVNDDVIYALAQQCVGSKQLPLPGFLSFLPFDSITVPVARIADWKVSSIPMILDGWLVSPWCDNIRLGNYMARLFIFLGGCGRFVFNIANTLVGLGCIVLFSALAFRKVSFPTLSFTLFVFLVSCPGMEPTCLWLDGSCNYLWGAFLMVSFLLGIELIRQNGLMKKKHLFAICVVAFFCGLQHEALSFPLTAVLGLLFLLEKPKRKIYGLLMLFVLASMLPYCFSPGNIGRMKMASGGWACWSFEELIGLLAMPLALLFAATCLVFRSVQWKKIVSEHLPVFLFTGISLLLLAYTVRGTTWGCAGPSFYPCMGLTLCILVILNQLAPSYIRGLAPFLALFSFSVLVFFAFAMGRDADILDGIISKLRSGRKVIVVDDFARRGSIPPTWHICEFRKTVLDSRNWPRTKTVYHIDDDMEMPALIFNHLVSTRDHYAVCDGAPQDRPAVSKSGNIISVRLPIGAKSARISGLSVESETGRKVRLSSRDVDTLFTLPTYFVRSILGSQESYLRSDDYSNGFYYVNVQLPQGTKLLKMHLEVRFGGEPSAQSSFWEISNDGIVPVCNKGN